MNCKNLLQSILCSTRLPELLRKRRQDGTSVVVYHGVIDDKDWKDWETSDMVSTSTFKRHLLFYKKYYNVVSLSTIVDYLNGNTSVLPPRSLIITFDDGYKNNSEYAVPLLKEHALTATFFLTTGFVDGSVELWWIQLKRSILLAQRYETELYLPGLGLLRTNSKKERFKSYLKAINFMKAFSSDDRTRLLMKLQKGCPGDLEKLRRTYLPMTWAEAEEIIQCGMEIGAHTVTHTIQARESDERQKDEVVGSVVQIRTKLSQTDIPFSYPNGLPEDFTKKTENFVREAGCYAAVAGFPGLNNNMDHLYQLRRFPIGGNHTVKSLELELCGLWKKLKPVSLKVTGY